jgi:ATP-binding cassette, subfamily B, bacterial
MMQSSQRKQTLSLRERLHSLRNMVPLLRMVWNSSPGLVLVSLSMHIIRAAFPFLLLWIPKLVLDAIIRLSRTTGGSMASIWKLVVLELVLALANDLLGRFNTLCDSLLGDRFSNRMNLALMHHAAQMDLASFEDPVFYDNLARARDQTGGRLAIFISILTVYQDIVTLVILAVGLVVFSSWLIVLLLVSVIPSLFGESRLRKLAYSVLYDLTPERRLLDYLRLLGVSAATVKEVKVFGLHHYLEHLHERIATEINDENAKISTKRAIVGSLLSSVSLAGYYGGYVTLVTRAVTGTISIGTFTFLTGSFNRSRACVERITDNLNVISENMMLLNDLFDFFNMEPTIRSPPRPRPVPVSIRKGFEFRNVSFTYPSSDRLVLRHISFCLAPREKLALVGPNGAGKTTIVKLAARLYDPSGGQILLDGVDLREYDLDDLRRLVGVIFQDYVQYDMEVRENIGFGDVNCLSDEERIRMAAVKSGAEEFIRSFPRRYSQILGRRFEGGIGLSGGQWQKIALARAYMRQARLLILDEPTASLDARAEYETFCHFSELMGDCMAMLISHRFSTVRMADRILVLADGEIREEGTHEQLLARAGVYAELFEMQAVGYR